MKKVIHGIAAGLIFYAVTATYAWPDSPVAPQCDTMAAVFGAQIDNTKPTYRLVGTELAAFNGNLQSATKQKIIDYDELLVYGPEDTFYVLVALKNSCVLATAVVEKKDFLKLLEGNRA